MDESLHRALADLEMLKAAYPDEVTTTNTAAAADCASFPLHCSFHLSSDSFVQLEFTSGYPVTSGVQIASYRSPQKGRMNAVVQAIRKAAQECLQDEVEGGFVCCAAALEAWNDREEIMLSEDVEQDASPELPLPLFPTVEWIVGETLMDRKSAFQARACRVTSERQVHDALHQLISGNSKLQRATHNMVSFCYADCCMKFVSLC